MKHSPDSAARTELSPRQVLLMSIMQLLALVAVSPFLVTLPQAGTGWGGRRLTALLLVLIAADLFAVLTCGRALAKTGKPFEDLRWWWPW